MEALNGRANLNLSSHERPTQAAEHFVPERSDDFRQCQGESG
jgi:hypothetical protein